MSIGITNTNNSKEILKIELYSGAPNVTITSNITSGNKKGRQLTISNIPYINNYQNVLYTRNVRRSSPTLISTNQAGIYTFSFNIANNQINQYFFTGWNYDYDDRDYYPAGISSAMASNHPLYPEYTYSSNNTSLSIKIFDTYSSNGTWWSLGDSYALYLDGTSASMPDYLFLW